MGAKLGGHIAIRLRQPAVLGELIVGILLGNLTLFGVDVLEPLRHNPMLDTLGEMGVIFLLFSVGLESSLSDMMKSGLSSTAVATLGVIAPMALGWGFAHYLLPGHSLYVHIFIGATLCATSVGITARVLADLKRTQSKEARIILGAAVIDDVLGLIVLAVVTGLVTAAGGGASVTVGGVLWIVLKSALFLVGSIVVGHVGSRRVLPVVSRLQGKGVLLGSALAVCLLYSYFAAVVGLAPIVGAFAAGLVLEEVHFKDFEETRTHELSELMEPLLSFLVPVFFVLMGLRVDLKSFADPSTVGLALLLIVAAVAGKQVCALGVLERGASRMVVGIGMIPRGEVGLIFANLGLSLKIGGERIIDNATFSAVVIVVTVTTLMTPPLLEWGFRRFA